MLDEILEEMHTNIQTASYSEIIKDRLIDAFEYTETRPRAPEKHMAKSAFSSTGAEKSISAKPSRPLRVCLICAPGGHLTELMRIKEAFEGCELSLITYKEGFQSSKEGIEKVYTFNNLYINRMDSGQIASMVILFRQMLLLLKGGIFIFADRKPDVVLSTGSEIAIPFMYLGKLLGRRIIFIESLCRIKALSATANIISPVADVLLVQWKDLEGARRKGRFEGNILGPPIVDESNREEEDFIFVTAGTAPFPRLVEMMDKYAGDTGRRIIIQIARTQFTPKHAEYFKFVERDEYDSYIRRAKIVITHGGVGAILSALDNGKSTIVVPRLKKFNEGLDNNQLEISEKIKVEPNVRVVMDVNEIPIALRDLEENPAKNLRYSWRDSRGRLIKFLQDYLESVKSEIGL
jgi:UDP-N-acetylglucosamine transferase subunit ALG13